MTAKKILQALVCLGLLTAASCTTVRADITADTLKTIEARPTDGEIRIDGRLNEPVWQTAAWNRGFRQLEPEEGQPASESTLVAILYDEAAVYVGFRCFDRDPDQIAPLLTRRDRWSESDQVSVRFDSHHDHATAYYFNINTAGAVSYTHLTLPTN